MSIVKPSFPIRFSEKSLYKEIHSLKNPTENSIKKLYGDFGLDMFNGKVKPTILSEEEKNPDIIEKILYWLNGNSPMDYEEGDSLLAVLLKYLGNKKVCLKNDIEEKFGKRGLNKLGLLRQIGYLDI